MKKLKTKIIKMMRQVFTTAVFFLVAINAFAQDLSSENLVGKWKLESVEINNEKTSLEEMFNTSEVYQVYQENKSFKGIVGSQSMKGKWELLKSEKTIKVTSKEVSQDFEVKSFKDKKMILLSENEQFSLLLQYKKVE